MKNRNILIACICVIAVAAVAFIFFSPVETEPVPQQVDDVIDENNPNAPTPSGSIVAPLSFTWTFEEDDSLNPDGNKQSNVILEIKYANGSVAKKTVSTVPGGCAFLQDSDEQRVAATIVVQCYYAGLGQVFKIVQGEKAYLVQRKEFEEGWPEYTPPEQKFETVAEFDF